MNIIYEGVDITDTIEIRKADIIDNAGGCADSIDLSFADTEGLWSKWKPLKGHKINVLEGGFSSGIMFTDYINQARGSIRIKGLSLPPRAKTGKIKAWESIRFLQMAGEIASTNGFALETFGVTDHLYERLDQLNETDFDFLLRRCTLEGYSLKICNSKVVIYSEQDFETKAAVKTLSMDQFDGDYEFKAASTGLYSACVISSGVITKEYMPAAAPSGPVLKPRIYITSLAEAERYCKGLLRAANKNENTGRIQIELDPDLAAGSCVDIDGVGLAAGKYFIEQAVHWLKDKKTILKLRKPLEGY